MKINETLSEWKKKTTPAETFKTVAGTIVGCGAMAAVVALMRGSTAGTKGVTKLMMKAGIFVLGCRVGDEAEKYFNSQVDGIIASLKEAKEELEHEQPDAEQQ